MVTSTNRKPSKKTVDGTVWAEGTWNVVSGRLTPGPGRPAKEGRIFQYLGEKLPFDCLKAVAAFIHSNSDDTQGVYMAHDSMGVARYGGRGNIFTRLKSHKKKYPGELLYFSFYIIRNKKHEREIETAILRAAGSQMTLNERKTALRLKVGNVSDYEPGTHFIERQVKRGRKKSKRRSRTR